MSENWMRYSMSARLVIIGGLVLVLLIPSFMIRSLISERQDRRDEAIREISSKWGLDQTITGPFISIPFTDHYENSEGETKERIAYAHMLPDDLIISGGMEPELRRRGIFEAVLYNTKLDISGSFYMNKLADLNIPQKDILWEGAYVSLGVSDMKGIQEEVVVDVDGITAPFNPGIESKDVVSRGMSHPLAELKARERVEISFSLDLNGSSYLGFIPLGQQTRVSLSSTWGDPSFRGNFLPEEHTISDSGFSADWKVLHLNRNYPQVWTGGQSDLSRSSFGVELLIPVDEYQKNMRTTKYAFMSIGLTFLSFFMIELLNKRVALHPIQYLLIGFALLVFYTLLLSISEHLSYGPAYLISSLATITLISLYTLSTLKSRQQTVIILLILVLLYAYLFILIQLQDFALLIGSIGLFVILSMVMYLTRGVDWFSTLETRRPPAEKDSEA